MDRVSINLISLVLGAGGVFAALTAWNAPEANHSFFGNNPFLLKREVVKRAQDWLFTSVAVLALSLQLGAEVLGDSLAPRIHPTNFYVVLTAVVFGGTGVVIWSLGKLASRFTRGRWKPEVIVNQREVFDLSSYIVEHDGREPNDPEVITPERKEANYGRADGYLMQMEKLLDIKPNASRADRVTRLKTEFNEGAS